MSLTIEATVHFKMQRQGRKTIRSGAAESPVVGRVPRIAKLMALALRFEQLIQSGQVRDYAELARRGRVTRARITQIMNLLLLAPDIQETLLFLPRLDQGRDPLPLRRLLPIALVADWRSQRALWEQLRQRATFYSLTGLTRYHATVRDSESRNCLLY